VFCFGKLAASLMLSLVHLFMMNFSPVINNRIRRSFSGAKRGRCVAFRATKSVQKQAAFYMKKTIFLLKKFNVLTTNVHLDKL